MKIKHLIILSIFLSCQRLVMGQDTAFYYTFGTIGFDDVIEFVETENNYIILGSTGGIADNNPDIYIIQLDKNFENPVYSALGTTDIERLKAVDYSSEGEIILLSQTYNPWKETSYDCRIDVLGQDLEQLNSKHFFRNGVQTPIDIVHFENEVFFILEEVLNDTTYKLLKTDSNLQLLDSIDISAYDLIDPKSIFLKNEGICIVGSSTNGQAKIIAFDQENLSLINNLEIGSEIGSEIGVSLTTYFDSNLALLTGSTNSYFSDDYDAFIALLDSTLTDTLWMKAYGWNSNGDNFNDFGVNSITSYDEAIYLGLTTNTFGQGGSDYHVYKLDTSGIFILGTSHGLTGDETLKQLFLSRDSTYFLIGTTNTPNIGGEDILIVKTKTFTSNPPKVFKTYIDDQTLANSIIGITEGNLNLELYIHCTDGLCKVEIIGGEIIENLWVYDFQGRIIESLNPNAENIQFHLQSGVYIVAFQLLGKPNLIKRQIFVR